MAEIHVQRRRKSFWWLWVLITLLIALVIYYLYRSDYFKPQNRTAEAVFVAAKM